MAQFGPVFGDLLVVKDPCCGDGDTFIEEGTVESSHGTVDWGAKHGGFGHCLSVGFGRSTRAYIMFSDGMSILRVSLLQRCFEKFYKVKSH